MGLHTAHCAVCTLNCAFFRLCGVHIVLHTLHSAQCTHCTLYTVHYAHTTNSARFWLLFLDPPLLYPLDPCAEKSTPENHVANIDGIAVKRKPLAKVPMIKTKKILEHVQKSATTSNPNPLL